jgi:hypothetical protein
MSADNYLFVRQRKSDGKFDVTHRHASVHYRDEIGGFLPKGNVWISDRDECYDTLAEALLAAHKEASEMDILEYGVIVQKGLI